MASNDPEDVSDPSKRKRRVQENGPYVLRSLIEDLPLSADGDRTDIEINCVEFLGEQFLFIFPSCSSVANVHSQIRTYILGRRPRKSSTSYRFPRILPTYLESPLIFWLRDYRLPIMSRLLEKDPVSSRFCCFLESTKLVYCVTGQSPFIPCQN